MMDSLQRIMTWLLCAGLVAFGFAAETLAAEKPAALALTTEEQAWLEAHPVIRVAADPDYPPFQFENSAGISVGVANDYLKLVAERLGVRFEYTLPESWAEALQLIKQHDADMVAVATETPERLDYMRFTRPYVDFPDVIITRAGEKISSLAELHGGELLTIKGFGINEFLRSQHPQIKLRMVPDVKTLLERVSTGEADAGVLNLATTSYAIERWKITNLHISSLTDFSYQLAFASRRDWPMLNQLLDKALASLTDTEKQQVFRKWITITVSNTDKPASHVELTATERQWLDEHPVILAAADPYWPPMEYLDQNGQYTGMSADYIKLVAERLGIHIEVLPQSSWDAALDNARVRKVAILTAAATTPERQQFLDFTQPYLNLPAAIIVNDESRDIAGIDDLEGRKVAVIKNYASHDYFQRNHPDIELVPVADVSTGLYAVSYGEVDALIANIASASYYIEQLAIQNLRVAGESGFTYQLGIASRNDWPILNTLLEKGVASLTPQERQDIYRKWIGLKPEPWKPSQEQLAGFTIGLVILGLAITLVWNQQLRRTVESRTKELRTSEQEFKNLYKTALVGLYRFSIDGKSVLAANPALTTLFGYPSVETFLQQFSFRAAFAVDEQRQQLFKTLRHTGRVDNFEFLGRLLDGSQRNFLISGTLYDEQGYLEGAVLDITDRKQAEDEARVARETAERASRAKTDFLAAASHDLRQPLHAISLQVGKLQEILHSDEADTILNQISSSQTALRDILDTLLDISHLDAGTLKPNLSHFPLTQLFTQLHNEFGPQAKARGFELRFHPTSAWVCSDGVLLYRVLANLVDNAIKHSRAPGVLIGARQRADNWQIEIWDCGPGIPAEQHQAIFEEFVQLGNPGRDRRQGLGLGLSIVQRLNQLLGLELQLASTTGRGSCFKLTVPEGIPVARQQGEPLTHEQRSYSLQGAVILVVDDDPAILAATRDLLASWKCAVLTASSIDQALDVAKDEEPDIVIADYHLADGQTGTELIAALQEQHRRAFKAVVITGDIAPHNLPGLGDGTYPVLRKPVVPLTLRSTLHRLMVS